MSMQLSPSDSFKSWKSKYLKNKFRYGTDIWGEIGEHPQDILFLELGKLYISANHELRSQIMKLIDKRPDQAWQLVLFIRRIAKLLKSRNDEHLIQIGLAIAEIAVMKEDFRDILVSLSILKYGAERVGINAIQLFNDTVTSCSPNLSNLLNHLLDWTESSIELSIKRFGPNDWAQGL